MGAGEAATDKVVTAAILIIGNEILSGRTQDANLAYIAKGLNEVGVTLKEVRVIPDVEATIVGVLALCGWAIDSGIYAWVYLAHWDWSLPIYVALVILLLLRI